MADLPRPSYLEHRPEFGPLSQEAIPDVPPDPGIIMGSRLSPDEQAYMLDNIWMYAYLSYDLIEAAWRLVEVSHERQGRYREGLAIPASCFAASAGAIALACAALEASLNEGIVNGRRDAEDDGGLARNRLLELAPGLGVRDRIDAVAALNGHILDWGQDETFQALDLVLCVRRNLLHHELGRYKAADAFWPAKKLRDVPIRIHSPYLGQTRLEWHQHVVTPAGAEWVVRTICDVIERMEAWWPSEPVEPEASQ